MKKPSTLIYGANESPPLLVSVLNGLQHVGLISINLVYPLLVFRAINAPATLVTDLMAIGLMVLGFGTFLQATRVGPVGSGYMCPSTLTAAYLGPSLLAVKAGGLPLLFGMTIFAGAVEAALSRLLHRLRSFFPPEISGLVIFMIGWGGGIAGLRLVSGGAATAVSSAEWLVAVITLTAMTALNIWGRGLARMLCALLGLLLGYFTAAAAALFSAADLAVIADAPWIGFPKLSHLSWSFDATLALPFAIAAIAAAMKSLGSITMCQRMNDAEWVRPEIRSGTGGVLADGITTMLAGAVGSLGTNPSTSSLGIAAATGVASRNVAYATGALFLLIGFTPKLAAVLAVMPRAVIVAALLFAVSFIMINGLQVMTSRLLDGRRTLIIGLSVVVGSAVEVFPMISTSAPRGLASLIGSSLVLSTLIALTLNLLFRMGVKRTVTLTVERDEVDAQKVENFFKSQGATWGARPDVVTRATFGVLQLLDAVRENGWHAGPMQIAVSFDEFSLDVRMSYQGDALEFPEQRPSNKEIVASENGARLLAGFMLRRCADRLRSQPKDGSAGVLLHYDH
jgi:NCS2 family nucleobase:cation symporter-2